MEGVYAIGDLIKGMQLAHLASAQGICLVEELAGKERSIDLSVVPACVYTDPEIASIGLTEAQAKEQGLSFSVGKFMMSANGKSLISKEERGFIKILAEKESGAVLGAQMMCARATDMIGEFGGAVANRFTVPALLRAMRAHPTYNEAWRRFSAPPSTRRRRNDRENGEDSARKTFRAGRSRGSRRPRKTAEEREGREKI